MKRTLISMAVVALLALTAGAIAQVVGPPVTQTASRLDAGMFVNTNGVSACNTVNTAAASNTVTITPPANLSVYITGLFVDITSDATGTTQTATLSASNVNGSPFWSLATLSVGAAVSNQNRQISETYNPPLKSTTPGTAVAFSMSPTVAHNIVCIRVSGYYAQ